MSISALIIDDEQLARDELKYLLDSGGRRGCGGAGRERHRSRGSDRGAPSRPRLSRCADAGAGWIRGDPAADGAQRQAATSGQTEPLPQIVFATAYDQYAVRAFDVNAVDYLLKPFDRARVQQARGAGARPHGRRAPDCSATAGVAARRAAAAAQPSAGARARAPQPAKLIVQAQSRLLLVDQADICFAAIDEGVIRVVTQHFRRAIEVPHA